MVSGSLAELGPAEAWKAELVSDGVGFRDEEISQQSIAAIAWSFLATYNKLQKERDNCKEPLNNTNPGFDDLGKSPCSKMTKDLEKKKCPVRKARSKESRTEQRVWRHNQGQHLRKSERSEYEVT